MSQIWTHTLLNKALAYYWELQLKTVHKYVSPLNLLCYCGRAK